jgi:Cu/Ag efflux pump CusA
MMMWEALMMLRLLASLSSLLTIRPGAHAGPRILSKQMLTGAIQLCFAARKRARPIAMTSIAMGAGMLPITLGIGADAETRAPMAIAVLGGLVSSTMLGLVYVPVVYIFINDIQSFLARHLGKLLVEAPGASGQRRTEIPGKDPANAYPA